jgi:hypothetical protein
VLFFAVLRFSLRTAVNVWARRNPSKLSPPRRRHGALLCGVLVRRQEYSFTLLTQKLYATHPRGRN